MKSDFDLKKDVESELSWEPSVNEAHVGVTAKSGVITLSGHVPTYSEGTARRRLRSESPACKPSSTSST
jgi:osmotically-inducible protein OsmY